MRNVVYEHIIRRNFLILITLMVEIGTDHNV